MKAGNIKLITPGRIPFIKQQFVLYQILLFFMKYYVIAIQILINKSILPITDASNYGLRV